MPTTHGRLHLGRERRAYEHDALGNLTAKNGVAHQYLDPTHAHAATHLVGSPNYTRDATGNMLTRSEAGGSYNQVWDADTCPAPAEELAGERDHHRSGTPIVRYPKFYPKSLGI